MIGRLLAVAIGLFTGLAASQAPEFAQQYRQRLGGAIDELRRVVQRFDSGAQASGLSRDQAITRLSGEPDPLVKRQGEAMGETAERLAKLERQRADFAEAGSFGRLAALAREPDPQLLRATYIDFEPAWPATTEGVSVGALGFAAGWLIVALLARALGRLVPGRRRQPVRAGMMPS